MDPHDPVDAQQVVIEYARVLERDITEDRYPARLDSLPFAKPIIKTAICTSAAHLAAAGQLTSELREYLENAYVFLAEYLDSELVELMTHYRRAAETLAGEATTIRERTQSAAWRTLAEGGALAGELARSTAAEAERLRREFRVSIAAIES